MSVLASADLGLITLKENAAGLISPSKLNAYLAMGLPILYIGPEETNVAEAIHTFNCGFRVEPDNLEQMVNTLLSLLAQPEQIEGLGLNARRAFEMAYNDGVTLPQFDEIIDSLGPSQG
jgi:glycosyltransferase involved in cell wall biosynthesis